MATGLWREVILMLRKEFLLKLIFQKVFSLLAKQLKGVGGGCWGYRCVRGCWALGWGWALTLSWGLC